MTREMNKPDWCCYEHICGDIWQTKCIGYPIIYGSCQTCIYFKPKERILNPDIADFFWATVERFKQC